MYYVIYETATGIISRHGKTSPTRWDFIEPEAGYTKMEIEDELAAWQNYIVDLEDESLIYTDPGLVPAPWADIKRKRDAIEVMPISVNGNSYDVDERSRRRMELALDQWENLPTLDQDNKLAWKLATNDYVLLSKTELTDVLNSITVLLAQRAANLHVRAEEILQEGKTVAEIEDLATWNL